MPPLTGNHGIASSCSSPSLLPPPGGLFTGGALRLPDSSWFGSNPNRQNLPLAGSALHACRPCTKAERLQFAGSATGKHVLAFKSNQGKLEDENVRSRRDLRSRNCLARFALYKGGEYPREHSAHAFPCSWKSVTVCRVVLLGFLVLFY